MRDQFLSNNAIIFSSEDLSEGTKNSRETKELATN